MKQQIRWRTFVLAVFLALATLLTACSAGGQKPLPSQKPGPAPAPGQEQEIDPDIIDLAGISYRQMVRKGYLEDLWPYIENDPALGRDGVLEVPLKAAEVDGGLYAAFGCVQFNSLVGAESVVGNRAMYLYQQGIQMLSMADISHPSDMQILDAYYGQGGCSVLVGYPITEGEVGSSFWISGPRFAMSSTCSNKEAAWEFIRRLLQPNYKSTDNIQKAQDTSRPAFVRVFFTKCSRILFHSHITPAVTDTKNPIKLSMLSPPSRFQNGKRRQGPCTIFRQNWQEKPEGSCLPVFYVRFTEVLRRCRRR